MPKRSRPALCQARASLFNCSALAGMGRALRLFRRSSCEQEERYRCALVRSTRYRSFACPHSRRWRSSEIALPWGLCVSSPCVSRVVVRRAWSDAGCRAWHRRASRRRADRRAGALRCAGVASRGARSGARACRRAIPRRGAHRSCSGARERGREHRPGRLCAVALVVGDHAIGDADYGAQLFLGESARACRRAVSYTHLTLPTICSV